MRKFIFALALAVIFVAMLTLAVSAASAKGGSSSGGSRSSSSSSSKSSSSSSSSKSSSGYKSSSGKSYNKASVAKARPKPSKPSSGKKQQPGTAEDLIPSRFAVGSKLPAGRSYDSDAAFLRTHPSYLDPYSPRYYGHSPSVYYYLYLAALVDDDDDNPIKPQRCHEYDADLQVCLDEVDESSGGSGCSSFVIWPWMLFGGGGLAVMKRRLRGSA